MVQKTLGNIKIIKFFFNRLIHQSQDYFLTMHYSKEDTTTVSLLIFWTNGWALYFELTRFECMLLLIVSLCGVLIIKAFEKILIYNKFLRLFFNILVILSLVTVLLIFICIFTSMYSDLCRNKNIYQNNFYE